MLKIKTRRQTLVPDGTDHYEPFHLDLQYLQIQLLFFLALQGLKRLMNLDVCKVRLKLC